MFSWLKDLVGDAPDYHPWQPQPGMQAPQMPKADMDRTLRALALHPDAPPEFNLQPTIDMLEIADMYGFKVTRE